VIVLLAFTLASKIKRLIFRLISIVLLALAYAAKNLPKNAIDDLDVKKEGLKKGEL